MIAGSNPAEDAGFFGRKNPKYTLIRRGRKAVCPMSQICGMKRNLQVIWKLESAGKIVRPYPSIHQSVNPSIRQSVSPSFRQSVLPSACLPACPPARLPTCPPARLPACLSVCLSLCLSVHSLFGLSRSVLGCTIPLLLPTHTESLPSVATSKCEPSNITYLIHIY
jgi:carboxypeptidase X2